MVSKRGIAANPKKIQALLQMQPPGNIKDVQRLTGCLAALSRFISRGASRSFPFFQLLRNMKTFQWTEECQYAFDDLKERVEFTKRDKRTLPGFLSLREVLSKAPRFALSSEL